MQTFQELIQGDYVYADKTRFIYDLASFGKAYFLSRPRRFGKSLLLSTFKALFNGPPDPDGPPQGLFKDLWIGRESDYDFNQKFPVVTLDMSLSSSATEVLESDVKETLQSVAESFGLEIAVASPGQTSRLY